MRQPWFVVLALCASSCLVACGPVVVEPIDAGPSGPGASSDGGRFAPAGVVTLVSGELRPTGVLAEPGAIYWIAGPYERGTVRQLELATGAVSTLLIDAGNATKLVADDHELFFSDSRDDSRIIAIDKRSARSRVVVDHAGNRAGYITLDAERLFWTAMDGMVRSVRKDGSDPRQLTPQPLPAAYDLVVDGAKVYVLSDAIYEIEKDGGVPSPVSTDSPGSQGNLAQDATSLYYSDRRPPSGSEALGTIVKFPKGGGTASSATVIAANQRVAGRLVVDRATVYWVDRGTAMDGNVLRRTVEDAMPTVIAAGQDTPVDLALTPDYLTWTNLGSQTEATGTIMAAPR
jgi:hypothetical protein